jgi:hypothetical protein
VIEHGGGRPARWLRANRLKIALLLGAAETLAILLTDATWAWALVVAAVIFAFHLWVGRKSQNETVRELSWAAAGSQLLPVLVPVIAFFVTAIAVIAVVVLAVVIGAMLFLDRR